MTCFCLVAQLSQRVCPNPSITMLSGIVKRIAERRAVLEATFVVVGRVVVQCPSSL